MEETPNCLQIGATSANGVVGDASVKSHTHNHKLTLDTFSRHSPVVVSSARVSAFAPLMYSTRPDSRVATRPLDGVAEAAAAVSIDPPRGTPSSESTPSAAAIESPSVRFRPSRPSRRLCGGRRRDEAVGARKKAALRPADADAAMDEASNSAR